MKLTASRSLHCNVVVLLTILFDGGAKSVQFVKAVQNQLGVDFFDRMQVAYRTDTGIAAAPMHAFGQLLEDGTVSENTVVFNNTLTTKSEFDTAWEIPVKDSWHARLMPA